MYCKTECYLSVVLSKHYIVLPRIRMILCCFCVVFVLQLLGGGAKWICCETECCLSVVLSKPYVVLPRIRMILCCIHVIFVSSWFFMLFSCCLVLFFVLWGSYILRGSFARDYTLILIRTKLRVNFSLNFSP